MRSSAVVFALLGAAPCALLAGATVPAGADPVPVATAQPAHAHAAHAAAGPAKIHETFDIVRKDDKIGVNAIDIDRKGDAMTVKNKTDIAVKVMYVTVYRYAHNCSETWKGGQLTAFKSQTDDNGAKHVVEVAPGASPETVTLIVDGKKSEEPKTLTPASLWSRALVTRTELFDPADGKRMTVKVSDLGDETLTIDGVQHQTRHYKISAGAAADFDRDLWFEGDGLLRMKMQGSDHSTIVSDLVNKQSNGT